MVLHGLAAMSMLILNEAISAGRRKKRLWGQVYLAKLKAENSVKTLKKYLGASKKYLQNFLWEKKKSATMSERVLLLVLLFQINFAVIVSFDLMKMGTGCVADWAIVGEFGQQGAIKW